MPTTAGRRLGIVVVLVLLGGAGVLAILPFAAGAVRIGSLNLLWWYAVVVAPLTAVLVAVGVLWRRGAPAHADSTAASR